MSLAEVFLANVPEARRASFAAVPGLEEALAELTAKGRAAWAEIPLANADFIAFLGRGLPEDVAGCLAALRGDDLWLACAYGRGVPGAAEALEGCGFASIAGTLAKLGAPPPMVADVLQELRRRLVEMQSPRAEQKVYAGRGELVGWLRVSAVREMNHRRNRRARELSIEDRPSLVASQEHEPDVALLLKTHKRELTEAFREALASMPGRARNVLRYYFIEGLSIDQIGAIYSVHRATAARWVSRGRAMLVEQTQAIFRARVSMSDEGFQRAIVLIESQIQVELAAVPPS